MFIKNIALKSSVGGALSIAKAAEWISIENADHRLRLRFMAEAIFKIPMRNVRLRSKDFLFNSMTFIIQITNDHKVKIPFRDGKNIFEKVFQGPISKYLRLKLLAMLDQIS